MYKTCIKHNYFSHTCYACANASKYINFFWDREADKEMENISGKGFNFYIGPWNKTETSLSKQRIMDHPARVLTYWIFVDFMSTKLGIRADCNRRTHLHLSKISFRL